MGSSAPSVAEEIARYLRTGDSDPHGLAWSGQSFLARVQAACADLENALVGEVLRRTGGWRPPPALAAIEDLTAFARRKVGPMVRGLFPSAEQDAVMALVERSVVFLSPDNIEEVLREASGHRRSAWDLANLYLGSAGAELLADDAPHILGASVGTSCYVSAGYFTEDDPFADFVVHEVAHLFHNTKRRTAGLPEVRRREWLLDIAFAERETFAYACEAYARVVERAATPAERVALAAELGDGFGTGDEFVERGEIAAIVRSAAERRNGWKVILERCSPPKRRRSAATARPAAGAEGDR